MTDQEALQRISRNVAAMLADSGLSQCELARRINTHPMAVKRIVDGSNMPGVGLLTRIAEALDCGLDDLLAKSPKILSRAS